MHGAWCIAGKYGRSAAVGQVAAPKAQMLGKQDWSYIAGARQLARGAHEADEDITCLRFSADNNTLLSRSEDATLKVCSTATPHSECGACTQLAVHVKQLPYFPVCTK